MHTHPYTAISRFEILTNNTSRKTCAKQGLWFFGSYLRQHAVGATAQFLEYSEMVSCSALVLGNVISLFSPWSPLLVWQGLEQTVEQFCWHTWISKRDSMLYTYAILWQAKRMACRTLLVMDCQLYAEKSMRRKRSPIRCIAVHRCTCRLQIEPQHSRVWS